MTWKYFNDMFLEEVKSRELMAQSDIQTSYTLRELVDQVATRLGIEAPKHCIESLLAEGSIIRLKIGKYISLPRGTPDLYVSNGNMKVVFNDPNLVRHGVYAIRNFSRYKPPYGVPVWCDGFFPGILGHHKEGKATKWTLCAGVSDDCISVHSYVGQWKKQ